jgi:hypothetical protein
MSRRGLSQPTFVDAMVSGCAKRGAPRRGGLSAPGSVQDPSSAVGHLGAAVEKTWLKSNMRPQGGNRKFLVLGAVQIRKGADLFIECAAILKSLPEGDRFQFVWIGDGFDPEYELGYSVYLADQIRRARPDKRRNLFNPRASLTNLPRILSGGRTLGDISGLPQTAPSVRTQYFRCAGASFALERPRAYEFEQSAGDSRLLSHFFLLALDLGRCFAPMGKLRRHGLAFAWRPVRIPIRQGNRMSDRQLASRFLVWPHPDVPDDDFISPDGTKNSTGSPAESFPNSTL